MWKLVLFSLLMSFELTLGQSCEMAQMDTTWLPAYQDPTVPFVQTTGRDIAFALIPNYRPFRIEITGPRNNQTVSFYVNENYSEYFKKTRSLEEMTETRFRCYDGSWFNPPYFYVNFIDTPTSPKFHHDNYTYEVSIPWPETIPINHDLPIWVRDLDLWENHTDVRFSIDIPSVLTPVASNYSNDNFRIIDFKVDLFLNPQAVPGRYEMLLTASDNMNTTTVPVILIVNEATCKCPLLKPEFAFGNKSERSEQDENTVNFYRGTIRSVPVEGQLLDLEKQIIEAHYSPKANLLEYISLSTDSDFLDVNPRGQVFFTRTISKEELRSLGPNHVIQIIAESEDKSMKQQVPLFISIQL